MYVIGLRMDDDLLKQVIGENEVAGAYSDLVRSFSMLGFVKVGGLFFYKVDNSDSVTCVLAFQEVCKELSWLKGCLQGAVLLRVDERANLLNAVN